jgi:UDP-4-amino-4,6-dideoxy-N-acetyl-beta-L-altrosamine transaminase
MKRISYGYQTIDKTDIREVTKVLGTDFITQGPKISEFENAICKYCNVKYAVAVSSGTAALHVACLAAGITKGDEVITSPITFVASANCVLYCGGKPVFADIDYDTANINPAEIEKKITSKTKAIIPIDFAGYPVDLDRIRQISKKHGLLLIEDACHALGAEYKGKKLGSISDMTVLSFHPVKHITTGEGGMVLTNNKDLYDRLLLFRSHGITKDKRILTKCDGPWYYEQHELGFNYRITDFQCALGISQLTKIDTFIKKRREIADRYNDSFSDLGDYVKLPVYPDKNKTHVWHLYVLRIRFDKLKINREQLFAELMKNNIYPQVHYIPIHKQPYYQKSGYANIKLANAEKYYTECISLPMYPKLTVTQQNFVIKTVRNILIKNVIPETNLIGDHVDLTGEQARPYAIPARGRGNDDRGIHR